MGPGEPSPPAEPPRRPDTSPVIDGTPPPPREKRRWVGVLAAVVIAGALLLAGPYFFWGFSGGLTCHDPLVSCPGGPGDTPLGAVLEIGNGTGACPAGNDTQLGFCGYAFALAADEPAGSATNPIPSPRDLTFELEGPSSTRIASTYAVTLVDRGGGRIGTWNSSTGDWSTPTAAGTCGSDGCINSALETGDALVLEALPLGNLPYSHQGDTLVTEADSGGFSGGVDAPLG